MRDRRFAACLGAIALALAALLALPAGSLARSVQNAGPPLPGGVYLGQTGLGKRLWVKVSSNGPNGTLSGVLRFRCANVRASFETDDGTFVAQKRNRRGALVFSARGRFASLNHVKGQVTKANGQGRCAPASYNAALVSPAGVRSATLRYGPFDVGGMARGTATASAAMEGTMKTFFSSAQRPCSNCRIVGMVPELVYANGKVANLDTEAMLHHAVLFNAAQRDASCSGWPERFFAAGNERTTFVLPKGYGYSVGASDSWTLLAELMNMGEAMQSLYVQMTYYFLPASAATAARPLWLDVDNCGDSQYSIPAGRSNTPWSYTVPASIAGRLVAIGGHVHNYGVRVQATNLTGGRLLCDSRAGYGSNPAYMGSIESMSGCIGNPLAQINGGDVLRLNSIYDSPEPRDDVMGIMVAFVDPAAT